MTTFKKGDRVTLNNHVMNKGADTLGRLADYGLVANRTYVVQNGGHYMVRLEGVTGSWSNDRFDLVKTPVAETHTYKVGDRVVATNPDEVTRRFTGRGGLGTVRSAGPRGLMLQVAWDKTPHRSIPTMVFEVSPSKFPEAPKVALFKRGDKVVFRTERANQYSGYKDVFTFGKAYEVVKSDYGNGLVGVKNDRGETTLVYGRRFDLAPPTPVAETPAVETPTFKIGDRVKAVKPDNVTLKYTNFGGMGTVTGLFHHSAAVHVKWDSYPNVSKGTLIEEIELVPAPVLPVTIFKVGEWVMPDPAHPYNKANTSALEAGKRYRVRRVSPSGKTVHLEGVSGARTSVRFVKAYWQGADKPLAASFAALDARVEAKSAPAPKPQIEALAVSADVLHSLVQGYLKDTFGIDQKIKSLTTSPTSGSVVFA